MKWYQLILRLWRATVLSTLVLTAMLPNAAAGTAAAAVSTADFAAIERFVEQQMQALRIPGLALAVVQDDQIIYSRGFGVTGPDGRAVTPQTPFQIASLTKPMTGLAIMQLVEAGKLALDAPVQRYLPWFRVVDEAGGFPGAAQITVRHLLYHTSGLPEAVGVEYYYSGDARPNALEERVRALHTVQLNRPVGSAYGYANAGYWVLGLLIEKVSGQSYETYMRTHLFAPLQMAQTFTDWTTARANGAASGHRYWFGVPVASAFPIDRAGLPAGGVVASAEDVAHFLIAQLNGGRFGATAILSAAGMAEMQRPVAPLNADEFYAMDWSVGAIGGVTTLAKGGALTDFKAQMVLIPARRMGVVVLMNVNKQIATLLGDMRLSLLPYNVVELLLAQPVTIFPASYLPILPYVALFLVVAIQAGGMTRTVRRLRGWQRQPELRPSGRPLFLKHLALPLLINLGWGLCALLWPKVFAAPLSYALYAIPDFSYLLLISGVVALAWAVIRTVLLLRLLRSGAHRAATTATMQVSA